MSTLTRIEARAAGALRYFTGRPCFRGHLSSRNTSDGHCVACKYEKGRVRRSKPGAREKANAYLKKWFQTEKGKVAHWRTHGVPTPKYAAPSACECCGRPRKLVVDHCHRTRKFRGWLCSQCNSGLGLLGDDIDAVVRACMYLASRS